MSQNDIIATAQKLNRILHQERKKAYFQRTMSWLGFLGLLTSNLIPPRKTKVTLEDLLKAGKLEPRVYELLPALLTELPHAIAFTSNDIPTDLNHALNAMRCNRAFPDFRGVSPLQYLQWKNTPALKLARKRLSPRGAPRARKVPSTEIGQFIREQRTQMGFTQKHFAETFGVSLRALRDLEQGSENVTLARTKQILHHLNLEIDLKPRSESTTLGGL